MGIDGYCALPLSLAFQASAQNYMHALALLVSPQAHSRIFFPFLYTISFSNYVINKQWSY